MDINIKHTRVSIGKAMIFVHYEVMGHPEVKHLMITLSNFVDDQDHFEIDLMDTEYVSLACYEYPRGMHQNIDVTMLEAVSRWKGN